MIVRLIVSSATALVLLCMQARAVELSDAELKAAQKLYVVKCSKCHELYDVKKYDDADWDKWMLKMKKKSRLKDDQFELLTHYTAEMREGKVPVVTGGKKK